LTSNRESVLWRWAALVVLLTVGWWIRPDRAPFDVHNCRFFDNQPRLSEEGRRQRLDSLLARPPTYGFRIDSILLSRPLSARPYQALRECLVTDRRTGKLFVTYWSISDDGEVVTAMRP
jgi:hypothetical protein